MSEWVVSDEDLGCDGAYFSYKEIVRCKDCKYASPNGKYGCKAYHFKLYETHEMKADDFCSHGERRE